MGLTTTSIRCLAEALHHFSTYLPALREGQGPLRRQALLRLLAVQHSKQFWGEHYSPAVLDSSNVAELLQYCLGTKASSPASKRSGWRLKYGRRPFYMERQSTTFFQQRLGSMAFIRSSLLTCTSPALNASTPSTSED